MVKHVHRRKRDVQPEVEGDQAPVVRENAGHPAFPEKQNADAHGGTCCTDAVLDERDRLRLRAEGKRGQKHDMEDVLEPTPRRKPSWRCPFRPMFERYASMKARPGMSSN